MDSGFQPVHIAHLVELSCPVVKRIMLPPSRRKVTVWPASQKREALIREAGTLRSRWPRHSPPGRHNWVVLEDVIGYDALRSSGVHNNPKSPQPRPMRRSLPLYFNDARWCPHHFSLGLGRSPKSRNGWPTNINGTCATSDTRRLLRVHADIPCRSSSSRSPSLWSSVAGRLASTNVVASRLSLDVSRVAVD